MASDITQSTGTEVPPSAPFEGMEQGIIVCIRCWSNPGIPILGRHRSGQGRLVCWHWNPLRPNRPVCPDVYGMNRSDQSFIEPIHGHFLQRVGSALVSHLGHYLVFSGSLSKHPGFGNIMCQWLLYINVFAHRHASHGSIGMKMVRCGDGYGINVFSRLVQHLPEIAVFRCIGEFFK